MEVWFPRVILALWIVMTFSPTLGGAFERAAFLMPLAWSDTISQDTLEHLAFDTHW